MKRLAVRNHLAKGIIVKDPFSTRVTITPILPLQDNIFPHTKVQKFSGHAIEGTPFGYPDGVLA